MAESEQDRAIYRTKLVAGLRSFGGGAADRFRGGVTRARDAAREVEEVASGGLSWAQDQARKLIDRAQELPEQLSGLVFTDCEVPTLLLPTGPGSGDFVCAFDFREAMEQLGGGVLVRPRIVAWAGHPEIDRARLASVLREEFTEQFHMQRDAAVAATDPSQSEGVKKLEAVAERTGNEARSIAATVAVMLGATLLIPSALAPLAFLGLALFGGTAGVQGFWRHIQASSDIRRAESSLREERKQLEADLDRGNERFRAAVERIEIRLHPILHDIVSNMSARSPPEPGAPFFALTGAGRLNGAGI